MTADFTSGRDRNPLSRAYDRLRKASYRAARTGTPFETFIGYPKYRLHHADFLPMWTIDDHELYLAGVRDALQAVAEASDE